MRTDPSAQSVPSARSGPRFIRVITPPLHPTPRSRRRLPLIGLLLLPCLGAQAEITLDGSLGGPRGPLAGPDVVIPAAVGRQAGENLFHSFRVFEVLAGESATFTDVGATGPIARILSRVTGGSVSTIDGLLASSVAGADLYLLNPAGVLFGPGAQLDVQGSFHVSTADYLTLGEEGRFAVSTDPQQSILTSAPPAAFGFLGETPPGAITVEGSTTGEDVMLGVPEGETLSLVGGDIEIRNGTLTAAGGRHNLVSVASAGEVELSDTDVSVDAVEQLGRIEVTDGSISASGESGGEVFIRGGELAMEDAVVEAVTTDAGDGRGIDVVLTESLIVTDSLLISGTIGNGDGDDISISAPEVALNRSTIGSASLAAGDAGNIAIEASMLDVTDSLISSTTTNSGNGGNILVQGNTLTLREGTTISSVTRGVGDGGDLTMTADESIFIEGSQNGAQPSLLAAISENSGDAGQLFISTPDLTINSSFVQGSTFSEGQGGDTRLEVGNLLLTRGAQIGSGSSGVNPLNEEIVTDATGDGGNLTIFATESITITDQNEDGISNGFFVWADGRGDAGNLVVQTPALTIDGGLIRTEAFGSGQGGNLQLEVDTLTLQNEAEISSRTDQSGQGGNLQVEAGTLTLQNEAEISSETLSTAADAGSGGNLSVTATNEITITNQTEDGSLTGLSTLTQGTGDAGNVIIKTPTLIMNDGTIIAGTSGSGRGGEIHIEAAILTMSDGSIDTATFDSGHGGDLWIDVGTLTLQGSALIRSRTTGPKADAGQGGNLTVMATEKISISGLNGEENGLLVSTEGAGDAGAIVINSSTLNLTSSAISSVSAGSGHAGDVLIQTDTMTLRDGAAVASVTGGTGDGGNLTVLADESILIEGLGEEGLFRGVSSSLNINSSGRGNAGGLFVSTPHLTITDDGVIQGIALSEGHGGNIRLEVETLTLTEGGQVSSGSGVVDNETGEVIVGNGQGANLTIIASDSITIADQDNEDRFASGLYAETYGSGNAGSIVVETPLLIMDDGSRIVTSTGGSGYGGDLRIEVENLTLKENAQISSSSGSITGRVGTGSAGNITVVVDNTISLIGDETVITSGTFGPGHAGNIFISAPVIKMEDGSTIEALGDIGQSGNIEIAATDLFLTRGAFVSNTASQANGGNIAIDAENSVFISSSGISSGTFGTGQGGNIDLQAASIDLRDGGAVTAESLGSDDNAGNAGNITLQGSEVLLDQQATISTEAENAGGGNITIAADTLQLTRESPISASVKRGEGSGGNVTLNAETIVALENSDITANVDQGLGGDITINAEVFLRSSDVDLDASSNVLGNEGEIQINTPDLDIAGSITNLPTTFLDAASRLSDRCAARTADTVSSFVVTGAGGIPPGPDGASLSGYRSTPTNTSQGGSPSPADDGRTSLAPQLPVLALFECRR